MKTTVNNNNIESKNGMSQVVIDLRPQVKHQDGHGREKVADVYFRTQVRAYSRQVYGDYSQEAHEAAEKALTAFYSEVVELLRGEGWTLLNDYAKWHNCPELAKGAQYLYVHPDSISGEVNPADIDALEAKFKALTACEYHGTDNYGDIVLTRSEADERMLYRETYAEGIADTIKECTTTKRSNLYKDRGDALGCIRNRIAIQNKRTDLTGHGTGYYRERKAVAGFVQEEYDRLLQAGYIKETEGQNGRTLCRWINKKEEKELNKARREAEKAEKERKAAERQERKEAEAKAEIESAKALSRQRETEGKPIGVGELVVLKKYGGMVGFITKEHEDGRLTFQIESKTWDERHTADMFTRIMAEKPAWLEKGQHVLYNGELHVIEIADAFGDIATCETNRHCAVIRKPQDEAICDHCAYVSWEVLIPCTPDGRELLPEPPAVVVIDEPDYYSEYQKLGHQEQRPQEWLKKTTDEKRAAYYRACVELERLAGDGLPLVIRADSADLSVNPWNALEKRVKTARVFHLGDRVKMQYPYQCDEVTGTICGIRFGQGCTWLGGWCTHYDVRFDEEYQRPNNFGGKDTGVGMVSPERIELVERAEFCPEPAADWLQPGEKVAHYLDYGDGTGDWLTGNVTGYELCDDGTVIVIYGEYRTPLKNMVKYRYEMDHKTA